MVSEKEDRDRGVGEKERMEPETQIRFIELCETRNWDNDYFSLFSHTPLTDFALQAISIPGHGSGKKFNFALSQVDGPSSSSLECIRQSKNKRTMQSLGKIRYKLKVQATDEIYETTRAKMAAANTAAKQNVPKVIKESGPRVGRKFKGTTAVAAAHKSFVSSGRALGSNSSSGNQPAISVTAPVDKSGPLPPKKGPRIAHSSALLSVPSPQQAYPVSNGRPAVGSVMNNNKYSSEKKSELKSHSRSPSSSLQTNGYSDLISHWANKPTSPSVPEPAPSSQKSSHSDAGSSCSSQTSAASPLSADDRQKLKSEFNAHYSVYKSLYSTLQEVSSKFWKLEEKLKNSVEGSEEWNVSLCVLWSASLLTCSVADRT